MFFPTGAKYKNQERLQKLQLDNLTFLYRNSPRRQRPHPSVSTRRSPLMKRHAERTVRCYPAARTLTAAAISILSCRTTHVSSTFGGSGAVVKYNNISQIITFSSTRKCIRAVSNTFEVMVQMPHMIGIWKFLDGVYVVGKSICAGDVEPLSQLSTVVSSSNLRGVRARRAWTLSKIWSNFFQFEKFHQLFRGGIS